MSGGYGRRIAKADDEAARTRNLARVGQVGNGIAIVGGVHALHQANSNFMRVKRGLDPSAAKHGPSLIARKAPKLAAKLKDPKVALGVAGAGVGLHVAELGGDAISHHFLHQAGKKQPIAKSDRPVDVAHQGVRGVHMRRQAIAKRGDLEYHDRTVSPVRLAGAGLGGGALLYGVPRLRATSNVIAYGRNHPDRQVRTVTNAAHRMAQGAAAASSPLGPMASHTLGSSPFTRSALKLPRSWRAGAATLTGAALLKGSLPIHTDRYREVTGLPQRGVV